MSKLPWQNYEICRDVYDKSVNGVNVSLQKIYPEEDNPVVPNHYPESIEDRIPTQRASPAPTQKPTTTPLVRTKPKKKHEYDDDEYDEDDEYYEDSGDYEGNKLEKIFWERTLSSEQDIFQKLLEMFYLLYYIYFNWKSKARHRQIEIENSQSKIRNSKNRVPYVFDFIVL